MSLKYLAGRLISWPSEALISARWFPLFRTFHLRRNWAYDVCRFAGSRRIRMVFDVGANIGETTQAAVKFFPDATIHAFEPVASTCATLRQRMARHPRVHAHQLALGRESGAVDLLLQPDSVYNSLRFVATGGAATNTEQVTVTTVDAFCARNQIDRIDVLKTDAQGFDVEVMQGAADLVARGAICFVYTEVGFLGNDGYNTPFESIDRHLRSAGFQLAGLYEQSGIGPRGRVLAFGNALYAHPRALELHHGIRPVAPSA